MTQAQPKTAPLHGLALYLGRALVDDPTPVEVTHEGEDTDGVFRLRVGPDDLGKVIGKKGRTAKALRTLIAAAGAKQEIRVGLEIVEPDREERQAKKAAERARDDGDTPAEDAENADSASQNAADDDDR